MLVSDGSSYEYDHNMPVTEVIWYSALRYSSFLVEGHVPVAVFSELVKSLKSRVFEEVWIE
jgi:hypothetical protein